MKPAPFQYHAPETVDEVIGLLRDYGDDAKVLAGGQSLVPMLALRLTRFEHLVDINGVDGLDSIRRSDGALYLGATTRHRTAVHNSEVATAVPLLAKATARVGHFQIRNRGTVGGAIAHADPAAEQPAVAVALDAVMEVASTAGTREVAAADFFESTWATALTSGDLLTGVRFPLWDGRCGFAVEEVARRSGDFALVGVVCAVRLGEHDTVDRAGVAVFGVGTTPVRAKAAEQSLLSGSPLDEVGAAAAEEVDPVDDLHASGDYRRKVTGVLVRRALQRAVQEAQSA